MLSKEILDRFAGWLEQRRRARRLLEEYQRTGGVTETYSAAMGRQIEVRFPPVTIIDHDSPGWVPVGRR
jgi:hypothetical protein